MFLNCPFTTLIYLSNGFCVRYVNIHILFYWRVLTCLTIRTLSDVLHLISWYCFREYENACHKATITCFSHIDLLHNYKNLYIHIYIHCNALICTGGLDDINFFNKVERYDIMNDSWTSVAPMLTPRGGVAVVAVQVATSVFLIIHLNNKQTRVWDWLITWRHIRVW